MCPTHRCEDNCRVNPGSVGNFLGGSALAGVVILGIIPAWAMIVHIFTVLMLVLGIVAALTVSGYGYWRYRVSAYRRNQAYLTQQQRQMSQMGYQQQQPMMQPQQQAIPQGQVHNHYGHTLALPGDWGPEQIRAFKENQ